MNLTEYRISTGKQGFYDITDKVVDAIDASGVEEGICLVFCPHTTAGITINENVDSDVLHDLLIGLNAAFPDRTEFRHSEGNSAAHLKSSCVGVGETVIVSGGKAFLGVWQGIYFCEFDGPRARRFYVKVMAGL